MSESAPQFGYEQTLKYEVARDLLNSKRAEVSEKIGIESAKKHPDPDVLQQLDREMDDIADQIEDLDVTDEAALDRSISINRR